VRKEKAFLATVDVKGLDPKLGSGGFAAMNGAFWIQK